jgi:toxin CcdB
MARYDVYVQKNGSGYLLDVQSDLLEGLNNRIVVPLLPLDAAPKAAKRLNPVFGIEDKSYVMMTQFMAAVPVTILKTPIMNLSGNSDAISNALDMIFYGF